jgi:hypothetical protein
LRPGGCRVGPGATFVATRPAGGVPARPPARPAGRPWSARPEVEALLADATVVPVLVAVLTLLLAAGDCGSSGHATNPAGSIEAAAKPSASNAPSSVGSGATPASAGSLNRLLDLMRRCAIVSRCAVRLRACLAAAQTPSSSFAIVCTAVVRTPARPAAAVVTGHRHQISTRQAHRPLRASSGTSRVRRKLLVGLGERRQCRRLR